MSHRPIPQDPFDRPDEGTSRFIQQVVIGLIVGGTIATVLAVGVAIGLTIHLAVGVVEPLGQALDQLLSPAMSLLLGSALVALPVVRRLAPVTCQPGGERWIA